MTTRRPNRLLFSVTVDIAGGTSIIQPAWLVYHREWLH